MASIKVKHRASSIKDHEGTIYYQIIHDRMVRQLNTNYHVKAEEWDRNRSMVTAKPSGDRKELVLSICEQIHLDVERLTKIARKLGTDGMTYTADDVIDEFKRCINEHTLFNYMENLITRFRHNGKTRTSETYTATMKSFRKFLCDTNRQDLCHNDKDIMLDRLSSETMEAYEAWHKKRGNSPNTISFYNRILRAVYNRAVEEEIIENRNPFRRVYTGVYKTVKRAVPLPIIKRIKDMDLSSTPLLDYARDMFLMSFYLRGMSFIDMAYLKKSDLKNGSVSYRRRKTGQRLVIGWTTEMQKILDKYPENPTHYLLPIIKTVGCNERRSYKNAGDKINLSLKNIARQVGIPGPLTLYVARHSWASAAKAKGIPLSVISEGMGHDSETTTQIYLASLDSSVVDKANSIILSSL